MKRYKTPEAFCEGNLTLTFLSIKVLTSANNSNQSLSLRMAFCSARVTGADVMARDDSGYTPLHAAAEPNAAKDAKNNILALLAANADVMVQNKNGKIPWDYAQNNDDIDGTDKYTALEKATCGWGYWFKNLVGLWG